MMKTKAEIDFIDTASDKLCSAAAMALLIGSDDFKILSGVVRSSYATALVDLIGEVTNMVNGEEWREVKR